MGKRTEHAPGTFSWVDLATSDGAAAKSFYTELLGWEYEDNPVPGGGTYSMARLDGDSVAAVYEMGPEMRERGVPPNWTSYVTVADADATAERARAAGGTIHAEPFDVMEAGRMTLIQDPTGAMLAAWQPRGSIGAERVNDPGCLTWNELATTDVDRAASFYGELFGWSSEPMDTGGGPQYTIVRNGERSNGGITDAMGAPPHWRPYFTVESTDAAAERLSAGGGKVVAGPMDLPSGRIAVALDPQGAAFAVFEGEVDD